MKELGAKTREHGNLLELPVPLYNTVHRDWKRVGYISDEMVSEYRKLNGFENGTYHVEIHDGVVTEVERYSVVVSSTYIKPTKESLDDKEKEKVGNWVLRCLRETCGVTVSDTYNVYLYAWGELVPDLMKENPDCKGMFALM